MYHPSFTILELGHDWSCQLVVEPVFESFEPLVKWESRHVLHYLFLSFYLI